MELPQIVSEQEWERSREELLAKEKEATRARDALAAERHRLGPRASCACPTSSRGAAS